MHKNGLLEFQYFDKALKRAENEGVLALNVSDLARLCTVGININASIQLTSLFNVSFLLQLARDKSYCDCNFESNI